MNVLPTTAGPGVADQAEALAETACELHAAASTSASWGAAAVEDAVEAMETTALALAVAHPDAAAAMLAFGQQLAQLRARLALPPSEHSAAGTEGADHQEQPDVARTRVLFPRADGSVRTATRRRGGSGR
ncbi:hypothetical protein ACTFBT_00185 [Streptomyces microflavus]|uniref:Uncharacterized protein n=1 Tax=Streptomyces microflavus TaxID=1919 RepID=A0A7J0D5J8_STRMI|nr:MULTISPECIES: hypothetical protein [Streptomyces]MCX4657201.1 hypothetical protein [Streptomyces microflavus]MDX2982087.1 hypothetical protein [Streptomyces sp. NRRL_B-2249]WSS32132.1 hypothetical protein OG269_01015 [Streptomyces microflavus]WST19337.1 hypothetical protein OG721_37730 [Streptomyces microflavus]SCK32734.1 hypothetical protein YUYDRAFT_03781 [Streptomyces sp. ScaeMP-e48]